MKAGPYLPASDWSMLRATILITAYDAGTTICRAIQSARIQGDYPILLVDDYSTDDTISRAREAAGGKLEIVRPPKPHVLGLARQTGIMALQTPYAVWLDADDELLPGRVERLIEALERERADLAGDGVELRNGTTGEFHAYLRIPGFIKGHHPQARLFERNYLPGIGVLGFRTCLAREVGYDSSLHGCEDGDFALRAVANGARFCLLDDVGYRLYAYPGSLSRRMANQRQMYRLALLKHDYEVVRELYRRAGLSERIAAWGLVSMALFREEYDWAWEFLREAGSLVKDSGEILEPSGPCIASEGWRLAFQRGTLLLLMDRNVEAMRSLEDAEKLRPTAEGANNLGVANLRARKEAEAQRLFEVSLSRYPEFHDAKANRDNPDPARITTHPLRSGPSRADYTMSGHSRS